MVANSDPKTQWAIADLEYLSDNGDDPPECRLLA
jgi:hypothetical protein